MFGSSSCKNFIFIPVGSFPVIETFFKEKFKRVGVQHFGPFVGIIPCGISSCENMAERYRGGASVAGEQHGVLHHFIFESDDILDAVRIAHMPFHIEDGKSHLSEAGPSGHEILSGAELLDQLIGNFFAGFIMGRETVQRFRFIQPVFLDLRRKLDEIPQDVGAAQG